jgi:hypothetical protein
MLDLDKIRNAFVYCPKDTLVKLEKVFGEHYKLSLMEHFQDDSTFFEKKYELGGWHGWLKGFDKGDRVEYFVIKIFHPETLLIFYAKFSIRKNRFQLLWGGVEGYFSDFTLGGLQDKVNKLGLSAVVDHSRSLPPLSLPERPGDSEMRVVVEGDLSLADLPLVDYTTPVVEGGIFASVKNNPKSGWSIKEGGSIKHLVPALNKEGGLEVLSPKKKRFEKAKAAR